ncbi:MAG: hypothetical protein NC301_02855 [Bacteroides sp.]|nr:hypothetical protein [Lachnospiraceae bacterium]MCM1309950.1 hypothetical protein [Bacteroides sp.]MCM1379672.1 hypothetical protein [Bacteroides sp.]MCM1445946.1 hypothetical protein [Prevotella sp.]
MKKYLHLLFVALFATMSFALTSCGDDDDDDEPNDPTTNSTLTINGVKYKANPIMSWDGSWDEGTFTVSVLDKDNNACGYTFDFTPSGATVKEGDNFANMSLTMTVMDVSDASMSTLNYVEGSVIAKSFGKNTMTVEFKNLKMSGSIIMGGTASYTFNGTATVDFEK